jgi:4-hydroxy-tetrahydrodipicolinate reductase
MVVRNFSLGSVVGTFLATVAAQFFEPIEIVETHHMGKADSPSGTAIRTAEKIAAISRESNGVIAPTQTRVQGANWSTVSLSTL